MLILRGLHDASDRELFDAIVQGDHGNTFITSRVEVLLKNYRDPPYTSQKKCIAYLGSRFRVTLRLAENTSDVENRKNLLLRCKLVHFVEHRYKFNVLTFMIRKLYALANGECSVDSPDSLQNQEILLGGYLYGQYIKEKWYEHLHFLALVMQRELRYEQKEADTQQGMMLGNFSSGFAHPHFLRKVLKKAPCDLGAKLEYLLATGNVKTQTGMDLQQVTGYTIVAEKLNYFRYLSHFRSVHRGSFFAELKTTTVRKLLPESWGFLCPVHTPDGAPCGLLNHLSHTCIITTQNVIDVPKLMPVLTYLGMQPWLPGTLAKKGDHCILLDGCLLGFASEERCQHMAQQLRRWKCEGMHGLPKQLEIGYIPSSQGGQYPGLYLFACPARMMRPVHAIPLGRRRHMHSEEFHEGEGHPHPPTNGTDEQDLQEDLVGTFEQVYMDIAMTLPKDGVPKHDSTTHVEIAPTSALSVVANMTPFSDFNQSPRNMYQCQMGKQTMGTPSHSYERRSDNKLYRLQTPQTPIVRPHLHLKYAMDEYPQGTNAVIAVISYTSYDMEDAMIINKSSDERGFGYGTIYKTVQLDLEDYRRTGEPLVHAFSYPKAESNPHPILDADGFPFVGARLQQGDPLACIVDLVTGETTLVKYKEADDVFVHSVRLVGSVRTSSTSLPTHTTVASHSKLSNRSDTSTSSTSSSSSSTSSSTLSSATEGLCVRAFIQLRMPRPPMIGDKFSSRHGQKGVCSQRWPMVDMPFTESGMVPDVIINPHAFPSRMTIGMLIEQMAAKAGAMLGQAQDATPFQFTESVLEEKTMEEDDPITDKNATDLPDGEKEANNNDDSSKKEKKKKVNPTAAAYFGEQLVKAGYNYYGNEPLYSGVTGELLQADIFMGVVYYQRLRHMVSDKFQVRSTGPIHPFTRQPVKGRKMAGGIRFGEMERDALLGHGTAFLLQDRLMHCSDYSQTLFCKSCCSFLGCYWSPSAHKESMGITYEGKVYECLQCQQTSLDSKSQIVVISVPYVFRYLCAELMGMGIRLKIMVE
ncbi:hypothetical protein HMI55_002014 [Coelomomyces lativittatus]|nr:hypothetical protein HMI55_002014 [Coelomomyces lativittatus]